LKCPVTPVRLQSKRVRHNIFILPVFNGQRKALEYSRAVRY